MCEEKYPRPDLLNDKVVPIVLTAVFAARTDGKRFELGPQLYMLLLLRGDKVAYCKNSWSMPAGVIDNPILRSKGDCDEAALFQSRMELAGELALFPEDLVNEKFHFRYSRENPEKEGHFFDTFVVSAFTLYPSKVYINWEHSTWDWVPVRDILSGEYSLPGNRTPNLERDIESLKPYMQTLLNEFAQ